MLMKVYGKNINQLFRNFIFIVVNNFPGKSENYQPFYFSSIFTYKIILQNQRLILF